MLTQEEKLAKSMAIANSHKTVHGFGKEYYALSTASMPDAILEFISGKIDLLYPELRKDSWISIPGVAFRLLDYKSSIYRVVDTHFLYIHKASFKRYLKKAICRNRNTL